MRYIYIDYEKEPKKRRSWADGGRKIKKTIYGKSDII